MSSSKDDKVFEVLLELQDEGVLKNVQTDCTFEPVDDTNKEWLNILKARLALATEEETKVTPLFLN